MSDATLITIAEATARTGMSTHALYRRIRSGKLAAFRIEAQGREFLVREADVVALTQPQPVNVAGTERPPTSGNKEGTDGDGDDSS